MFNEPLTLSVCGVVRERLLPCRVVVTAKWVVSCTDTCYVYPAFVPLLADVVRLTQRLSMTLNGC